MTTHHTPEEKAQQAARNVFAMLQHLGFAPGAPAPFLITKRCEDRVFFRVSGGWDDLRRWLNAHSGNGPQYDFEKWSAGLKKHGLPNDPAILSWRQRRWRGMQLCLLKSGTWEGDFDRFNPNFGLGPVLLHGLEVLKNWFTKKKTDPFKVAASLRDEIEGIDV